MDFKDFFKNLANTAIDEVIAEKVNGADLDLVAKAYSLRVSDLNRDFTDRLFKNSNLSDEQIKDYISFAKYAVDRLNKILEVE